MGSMPCTSLARLRESAAEKVKTYTEEDYDRRNGEFIYTQVVDKQSILNAYPLDNVK